MDKIAYIAGEQVIYWNSIVLTLAAATAIFFFLAFYIGKCGNAVAAFGAVPVSIVLSIVLARFIHWYSRADSYEGFLSAMTDYTSGGYALLGVFAGCALTAALLRLVLLHRNLPEMLDCMSLAGLAGIAVGRLASFFNASDRGNILENVRSLPFAWPVTNTVSGVTEYRLATFVIQAFVALVLFAVLAVFYLRGRRNRLRDGDTCLIFLLIYGASQVVLDSTRYDSLFLRSNGFISVVQIVSLIAMVIPMVIFSVRMVKTHKLKKWQFGLWVGFLAMGGVAGYMEYYVQRHGDKAVLSYSVMSAALAVMVIIILATRIISLLPCKTAESQEIAAE